MAAVRQEFNLLTYANWRYESSRQRLLRSARRHGNFRFWSFSDKDFRKTDVYRQYPAVTLVPRGAGLWLWKPYYIRHVLSQLEEGEKLIYLDAGFELIAPLLPLVDLVDTGPSLACFKVHEHINAHWTKRDCFVLMGCEGPEYRDTEQTMSGNLVLRKCPLVMELVEQWFSFNTDPRIVSDQPNTCGLPNFEGFVEHRHDQSILNNLRVQYGIPAYTDPSQYGENFRQQAKAGVDDYPTLLNLHRERLPSWRTALRLAMSDRRQFLLGVRIHLRRIGCMVKS